MKNKIKTTRTNWGDYKPDFVQNADYRKFSDGLKLVLSGTVEQRIHLRNFLEDEFKKGNVNYRIYSSPAAMTTCFVTDYQGKHIHYIVGTEGRYAAASMELKQQLKALMSNK